MGLAKSVSIFFKADTKAFQSGLDRASRKMQRFGKQTQRLGRSISTNFSVPFALAAGASVKMVADFDTSMTKIQTLVGASESQVNQFKDAVLELSGKTAQAPKDLADGLFFLTSAGLKGANALETLEQVSKGVAIGLGEQTDLAKIAGAAQNAYGKDVLSASESLDIFGKMVKTGMFESSELANVLGKEAGFAAALGISFEELGAFISTYTRTTGDATSATVGVSGVMMAFTKQTDKGEKALSGINMSYGQLKEMLGEKGLQKTLIHLKDRFAEENIELSEFFSKSQSLKGVINVLGNQTGEYVKILDDLKKSTGFVNDGFKIVEETIGFKMKKAWNDMKLAMMEFGVAILPVVEKLIGLISTLAEKFRAMTPEAQESIAILGAGFAAGGPILIGIGLVISSIGKIGKALKLLAATPALMALGLAIAGVVKVMGLLKESTLGVASATKRATDEVNIQIEKYSSLLSIAKNERLELGKRQKAIDELNTSVEAYNGGLTLSNVGVLDHTSLLKKEKKALMEVAMAKAASAEIDKVAAKLFEHTSRLQGQMQKTAPRISGYNVMGGFSKITALGDIKAIEILQKELDRLTSITLSYSSSTSTAGDEVENLTEKEKELTKTIAALQKQLNNFKKRKPTGTPSSDSGGGGEFMSVSPDMTVSDADEVFTISEILPQTVINDFIEGSGQIQDTWGQTMLELTEMQLQFAQSFASGVGDALANAIVDGENFGESMVNVFKALAKQIIATIVQAMILNALLKAFPALETLLTAKKNFLDLGSGIGNVTSANDIAFGPSSNQFITGPAGTFQLNPNDSIIAGTNLFGGQRKSENLVVNGYISGESIYLSNGRETNTINRLF